MPEHVVERQGAITLRVASAGDIEFLLAAEADPENARGITAWERAVHLEMMADESVAFLMVESDRYVEPLGFLVCCGLDDANDAIELRRIVITRKGHGYGREALRAVKRLAFEHYGAHRFWLDVFTDNPRAQHVYETEGFVREGVLRDSYKISGHYKSVVLFSVLENEHRAPD